MKHTSTALPLILSSLFSVVGCSAASDVSQDPQNDDRADITTASAELASGYRFVGSTSKVYGGLLRTEITMAASSNPLDRFRFQRTAKLFGKPKASLFLLPSRNCNSTEYEWSDDGTFNDSFVGFLATNGIEVWGFAPRTSTLPAGQCAPAGSVDCSVAKNWGLDVYVQDIDFMRQVFRVLHPGDKPFVGGLSLGTILGYATVNSRPRDYAGLIAWENAILSNDPEFKAGFAGICGADEQALLEGRYVDDQFGSISRAALLLFQTDPDGPTPFPFFPGFSNRQAFVGLFSLPAPGVPIPGRGFVIQAGDPFVDQTFKYTNFYRATKMLEMGNYSESIALERDFDCSFSGKINRFSQNLKSFIGPILYISEGLGFGRYGDDSVSALGSTDITRIHHEGWGHADSFLEVNHRANMDKTILNWLISHQ